MEIWYSYDSLYQSLLQYFNYFYLQLTEQPEYCLPIIEEENTRYFQYSVQMEKPFTEGTLPGFVNYQMMDTHAVQLEFSVNLSLLDFIR